MGFSLTFDRFAEYDAGLPGVTLDITLQFEDRSADVSVKIDTGSTDCIFSRSIADQLGLNVEIDEVVGFATATGRFNCYRHEVTLQVLGRDIDATVYFAQDHSFDRNVLGRHGFLDRTVLGLVDYEGRLYLREYGTSV